MGLISGLFLGMVLGIALMAGWKHMMQYRSTKRIAKAVDIKLLGSLNRDDLRKICGENFPEWISFPVFEQVKWLNKQLSKLWPFIADAAEMVIKESVEPLLEEYRPPGITSLKFSKLSLGNVAPKIEGIRVQSLKKGQITMDIDLRWGGDPSIILGVEAALVASIPIQLKDLQVFTVVRVIFQLAEEMPCISAVVVALLSEPKPRIDYTLKAVGGSLTAIPGLSDMIDDTVDSIVTDMLQWPHRLVVPIGGVPVDTSELELKPQGKLTLTIVKASDLKNMEMIGKSDPYVVLHIRPLFKVKTKVVENNLNPVWDQAFELIAEDKETQSLVLEVFDKDIAQDKRLGVVKLPLIQLEAETDSALFCASVQQPISVGIDGSAWDFQLYTSGIYDGECSGDPDDIDHAVLIVGYGSEDGEDYWIVKNSWGTEWGIEGYIYIRRNTNLTYGVCAINAMASYPTKESSSPSPYPSPTAPPPPPTPVTPPPPPPTPVTPPPPPSPSPSECGDFTYCPSDETCCCIYEFYGFCLIYGCCPYENAVCCTGTEYCCPGNYPICDVEEGLCLKNSGDYLGVSAKRRKMAKHKFPWTKFEEEEKKYQPLEWKRNRFAALR